MNLFGRIEVVVFRDHSGTVKSKCIRRHAPDLKSERRYCVPTTSLNTVGTIITCELYSNELQCNKMCMQHIIIVNTAHCTCARPIKLMDLTCILDLMQQLVLHYIIFKRCYCIIRVRVITWKLSRVKKKKMKKSHRVINSINGIKIFLSDLSIATMNIIMW